VQDKVLSLPGANGARLCEPQHTGPDAGAGSVHRLDWSSPLRLTELRPGEEEGVVMVKL